MNQKLRPRRRQTFITTLPGLDLWLFLAVVFTLILPLVFKGIAEITG
jgi:hypothetical protein